MGNFGFWGRSRLVWQKVKSIMSLLLSQLKCVVKCRACSETLQKQQPYLEILNHCVWLAFWKNPHVCITEQPLGLPCWPEPFQQGEAVHRAQAPHPPFKPLILCPGQLLTSHCKKLSVLQHLIHHRPASYTGKRCTNSSVGVPCSFLS